MTMRQVFGLLKIINKAHLVEFYYQVLSYNTVHGVELPSLDAFLNLSLGDKGDGAKAFDEKTDKYLEEQAFKKLHQRKGANG
jgi:hypothetical protein